MHEYKGVGIDFAFFAKTIYEYKNNSKEIYKIYKGLKKELFDNEELFEYIQYNIRVFNRAPDFEEIKNKFGIELDKIKIDDSYSLEYFIALIKDRYLKRAISKFSRSISENDITKLKVDDLYRPVVRLSEEYKEITDIENEFAKPMGDLAEEAISMIESAVSGSISGAIYSPWPSFQKCTGGVLPGEYTIIAGRPGTGKTWLLYKWAYFAANNLDKKVLLFNTEMSGKATLLRLACLNTGYRVSAIRNKTLTRIEADNLKNEINRMKNIKNLIITDIGFTPSLSNIIKEIKAANPDIVFIDSAYLIRSENAMTRTENASEVSDTLKNISLSFGIPIVCAIQHNREAVRGSPSLATLSLTDSNAWNASFVLSIDPPPAIDVSGNVISTTWKIHLIKNREGDLGSFYVSKENYEEVEGEMLSVFGARVRI